MGHIARIFIMGMAMLFAVPGPALANSPEAAALFNQGKAYHDGIGTAQDFDMARAFYERAAAAGSTDAQLNLGYLYFVGEGVKRDFAAARAWYEKAAQSGDASAAKNLGFMDKEGLGLPPAAAPPAAPSKTVSKTRIITKTAPTALPETPRPVVIQQVFNSPMLPLARDYASLSEAVPPAQQQPVVAQASPDSSFSAAAVFGSIIAFALALGGLIAWLTEYRAVKARRQVKELARQFFESNRRVLREIYLRYPAEMRDMGARESGWAVAISVLIVRFVIARDQSGHPAADAMPAALASEILGFVKTHPAKARHKAFTLVPDIVTLVQSDIRAFDKEHETAPEAPPIYKSPRKNPRKIVWKPRIVANP